MLSTFARKILSPIFIAIMLFGPLSNSRAQTAPTDRFAQIFGLSLVPQGVSQGSVNLYIATKSGLLKAGSDGVASLVPGLKAGLSSLAVNPENPNIMLTSGFASESQKIGVIMSSNGGNSWSKISDGADGPVAFRSMDISRADTNVIYAIADGLQISRDAGHTWETGARLPDDVFALAASSLKTDTLYTATRGGLFFSKDAGLNWDIAYKGTHPATLVHTAQGGKLYAFIYGIGLLTAQESDLEWKVLSKDFADRYIINLAVDPGDPKRLYATVDTGAIMISGDGGKTWGSFEGSHSATAENVAKGKLVYENNCVGCHGVKGIGEAPDDPSAKDEYGFKAPALNDDAHAWHHSDKNISESILNGSPRNERMTAFSEILSGDDVENVIVYLKSLWSFRSLACQGGRHMACMSHGG